ncbi:hypothetical protein [Geosporobacter ferrireducens]|uniref:hypothetical protein n=1 Tax=Geosporobacter ferrireducens TaxID=1424294 RepID=UPI00139C9F5D|nr:hypothetical protein [Geosporobacter ferrireducens]MTI56147.1 hypothetical protein [Geosporobacter ferrireducens]
MTDQNLNYEADHYCPVYEKVITPDLCYESLMCLNRTFKVSSVPELAKIKDIDKAREICDKCPYSSL